MGVFQMGWETDWNTGKFPEGIIRELMVSLLENHCMAFKV